MILFSSTLNVSYCPWRLKSKPTAFDLHASRPLSPLRLF